MRLEGEPDVMLLELGEPAEGSTRDFKVNFNIVNVGGVPLQKDDWAFWALCGMFLVGVLLQLWMFRRRRWL